LQASFVSAAPPLLLIGLIIYLGAEEGGFFPEATAAAAVALAAALILRTALAKEPLPASGWHSHLPPCQPGSSLSGL
jgi:hypothetical protein